MPMLALSLQCLLTLPPLNIAISTSNHLLKGEPPNIGSNKKEKQMRVKESSPISMDIDGQNHFTTVENDPSSTETGNQSLRNLEAIESAVS